jgi:hypothetical protein
MRPELRDRRQRHLYYIRIGVPYTQRCRRLAEEYDVSERRVQQDEQDMDEWLPDVTPLPAGLEQKASFLLAQHRQNTAAFEQLAGRARSDREDAEADVEGIRDRIAEVEAIGPEGFEDPDDHFQTLTRLYRQLDGAKSDVYRFGAEERRLRGEASDNVEAEFEMRQTSGQGVEKEPEELHVREERETEKKLLVGFDAVEELPGIDRASVVGAQFDGPTEDAATIEFEDDADG